MARQIIAFRSKKRQAKIGSTVGHLIFRFGSCPTVFYLHPVGGASCPAVYSGAFIAPSYVSCRGHPLSV